MSRDLIDVAGHAEEEDDISENEGFLLVAISVLGSVGFVSFIALCFLVMFGTFS